MSEEQEPKTLEQLADIAEQSQREGMLDGQSETETETEQTETKTKAKVKPKPPKKKGAGRPKQKQYSVFLPNCLYAKEPVVFKAKDPIEAEKKFAESIGALWDERGQRIKSVHQCTVTLVE